MDDVSFDVHKLGEMKRPQLQKLCKKLGIKANSKTSQLISDLKAHANLSQQNSENPKTPEPKPNPANPATTCLTAEQPDCVTVSGESADKQSEEQYKQELMQQLEKKVQETLKESKIPRLTSRNVTFTIGSKSPNRKSLSKTKEHSAFKKMDSIDVYLEKKRKRTQSLYANIKKAKGVANSARNIIADMKASHNTPARESPKRKRRSTYNINKNEDLKMPTSFSFGQLKSPKVIKPVFAKDKQRTPAFASRKSLSSLSIAKENKTLLDSRKSIAVTPFRCNGPLDTTTGSSVAAKKKFDLQASLSKPLKYKPHKGKIEKFPFVSKESKIPIRVNKKPLIDHKVDVKNVKITSRAERRQNNRSSRADKRQNAMLARRGLAN